MIWLLLACTCAEPQVEPSPEADEAPVVEEEEDESRADAIAKACLHIEECGLDPKALVTRPASPEELRTKEAEEALGDEVGKMLRYDAWDLTPTTHEEARRKHPTATWSKTFMLRSVNHAEREKGEQKHKARL